MQLSERVGVVVIGRNEGERLKRCLRSIAGDCPLIVYVDSGSTDGSVEFAQSLGVDVVNLDMSAKFTMARGRNAGLARVCEIHPEVDYIQFVDGDCEVVDGWLPAAVAALDANDDVVAVCGRRRERTPETSCFNRLCDLEWDVPPGVVRACGGDAMFRRAPIAESGGYNEEMIAGEEAELSFRLRAQGWSILRIDHEMTRHDAAMTRISQWFRRNIRTGHAFAEGAYLHGQSPERYNIRPVRSALFWGLAVPSVGVVLAMLAVFASPYWWIAFAGLVLMYGVPCLRVLQAYRRRGKALQLSLLGSIFCVAAKIPEALGVVKFHWNVLCGRRSTLIEYK